MTKHLRYLFAALLVWVCTVGGYAETKSVVCTLGKNAASCTSTGDCSVTWTYGSAPTTTTSPNNGMYWAIKANNEVVLTASLSAKSVTITSIKIQAYTNSGTGKTIEVYVGDTKIGKTATLTSKSAEYTFDGSATGDVLLHLKSSSSTKSHIVKTVTINYEESGSSSLTSTTTSFGTNSGKTFNFTNGVLEGFTAPTATAKAGDTDLTSKLVYSSSDEDVVTVASDGTLTFTNTKFGEATIKAEIVKDETYDGSSDTYTVVNSEPAKTATSLSFGADKDGSTVALTEGLLSDGSDFTGYTATEANGVAGTIAYAAKGDNVATVDATSGAVTVNKTTYGTTTITATFTPTDADTYAASTATYTITNKADAVFYESFDKCAKDGGNDGKWNGIQNSSSIQTDVTGWNFIKGNAANQCARFGTSGAAGSATTPSITLTTGAGILSFKAAAWSGDNSKSIKLSISNGTLTYNGTTAQTISIDLQESAWTECTNISISATEPFTIKFAAVQDKNNRFFLDEVIVKQTKSKLDPQLSFAEATQTKQMEDGGIVVPLQTVTKAEGLDAEITYSLDCESSVAEISGTDILVYKAATIVVTATSAETDTYKAGSASYTLNVTEQRTVDAAFKFDAESYEIDVNEAGGKFNALSKLQNPNQLAVTWTISPTDDGLIDENGLVVVDKRGTYTITATGAANDSYLETIATCQLVVKDNTVEDKTVTFIAGVNKGTQTTNGNDDEVSVNPVSMLSDNAAFAASTDGTYTYRFYKNGGTMISTKIGKITKVEFVGSGNTTTSNSLKNFTVDTGDYSCEDNNYGVWTGSAKDLVFTASAVAYATQIIVTLEVPVMKQYTFSQSASSIDLEDYDNADVKIDRTMTGNDGWWTLCLPFALDATQVATYFGDGAKLRTLDSMNGTTMNFKSVTEMEAGKPYLIYPTKDFDGGNTTFECVQLKAEAPESSTDQGYSMLGTYTKATLATDGTDLFLGADNKFYKPSENGNVINGFRVYFQCPADKVGMPMVANIDGVETAITRLDGETFAGAADTRVYNLQGQYVGTTLRGLASGIYVCGGRKVVVK